jgi:hypothetical protein
MERIEAVANSHFTDSVVGGVSRKQRLLLDRNTFDRLQALGLVRPTNPSATTASEPQPTAPQAAGGGESSVSSQADQASQPTIVSELQSMDGRLSPSTTHGDLPATLQPSMRATVDGGMPTTPKSRLTLKAKGGAKTRARRGDTD